MQAHFDWKLQHVAVEIESQVRGWYNYYNKFGKTELVKVMNHLNMVLAYWICRKYKRFHRKSIVKAFSSCNLGCTRHSIQACLDALLSLARAFIWLQEIAGKDRSLFYHWQRGQPPPDYVYAQNVECEEPCEGRLSRTVL